MAAASCVGICLHLVCVDKLLLKWISLGSNCRSIAPQILHLGPPTSEAKIGPASTSGTLRGLEIGYRALMLRWISLASAWLGAAKAPLGRRFSRFAFRVRRGAICCRGARSRVATEACEKGRRRLRLHHRWGRARIRQVSCAYQRVSSWPPRPHAAVWLPSLGCPLGRSLPRLPMGWRGLARGLCTSPPMHCSITSLVTRLVMSELLVTITSFVMAS